MTAIKGLKALLILIFCLNAFSTAASGSSLISHFGTALGEQEYQIFELVNRERSKKRLGTLEWDEKAARVAKAFSRQMAREEFFDHVDPRGNSVVERADKMSLTGWSKIGENLFVCQGTQQYSGLAVKGWLRSSSHRRNMLDRHWRATGIGVARGQDGSVYVTQVFIN